MDRQEKKKKAKKCRHSENRTVDFALRLKGLCWIACWMCARNTPMTVDEHIQPSAA